ncbi:flagellar motor switch phosphatase FliY [Sediminibacillus massiliensis]|uniref:flagellar motor switch phosphatase FliY n=1 Tax=Sediminibacillus massiliensis TaxID=1926277 RepID=UPI0009886B3B|nr:flagellar motor switch phosphatase FliY [Sediminibacillus massiliensis]
MNDDMLSQEEIDALLKNTEDDNEQETRQDIRTTDNPPVEDYLSIVEQDALGEIGNISFGSSATTLSTLLNQKVEITTPEISVISKDNLSSEFPEPNVGVEVEYTEGFSGVNLFVIESGDAAVIADLMLGGDGQSASGELNEIHLSAVQEAMNQMMGTAATSMSTVFSKKVDISPPSISMIDMENESRINKFSQHDIFVKVSFQLKIGDLIDSNIMQLLPVPFAKQLVDQLMNPEIEPSGPDVKGPGSSESEQTSLDSKSAPAHDRPQNEQVVYNSHRTNSREDGNHQQTIKPNVQQAEFSSFEPYDLPAQEQRNLDMLMDIPLNVTVELGRTKRSVKEILELSSGSIIELDKLAGEPVDIHVNDKLIAKGEVVVIDENFGVRVTDIISQTDRIKKLN